MLYSIEDLVTAYYGDTGVHTEGRVHVEKEERRGASGGEREVEVNLKHENVFE